MTPIQQYETYKQNSKSERTADRYIRTLRQLSTFHNKPPEQITEQDLYQFLNARDSKENTKNLCKVHFRDFLKFCERRDIKTKCKTILVEMKRAGNDSHKPLWGEDKKTLIRFLRTIQDTSFRTLRDLLLVFMLLDTGARVSEITDLKFCDIEKGRAYIKTKKRTTSRWIKWTPRTQRLLDQYLKLRADYPLDTLFIGIGKRGITELTPKSVQRIFKTLCDQAGIKGYVPHSCRHGRAIEMHLEGYSLEEIRRMLGHTTLLSVQTYLQENDESFYNRMSSRKTFNARQFVAKHIGYAYGN